MKNYLKIILIITILLSSFGYGFSASAEISAYNIKLENLKNGQVTLKWRTNQEVKSVVYYGQNANNLDKKYSNDSYKKLHQANLYGLKEDETYYYKIELYGMGGEKLDIYTRSFSTKYMLDTISPKITEAEIIQSIGNTVALSWQTNEKTYAEIHYWVQGSQENKKIKYIGDYNYFKEYFIYDLYPDNKYYVKIVAKDKSGNKRSKTFSVNIYQEFDKNSYLIINRIEPLDSDNKLIFANKATIKFRTNLASRAKILYGTNPERLREKIHSNYGRLATKHEILIEGLQPNTTYYYRIQADGAIFRKKNSSELLSFTTKNNVLGVKENAANIDSDHDQLSNALEMAIGTDPSDPDTDNDGYRDGIEVKNGYNPLGAGKWDNKIDFYYGQPRMDLNYENQKALELKKVLDKKLKYIYISPDTWKILVRAYVYGDYPLEAIVMYARLNGKTVHPEINWHSWKNSLEYQPYAKYIK